MAGRWQKSVPEIRADTRDRIADWLESFINSCVDEECAQCQFIRERSSDIRAEVWKESKRTKTLPSRTPPPEVLHIPKEFIAKCESKGWGDPTKEVDRCLAWHRKKSSRERDWLAVLEMWMIKQQEFAKEKPQPIPQPKKIVAPVKPALTLEERRRLVEELNGTGPDTGKAPSA